MEIYTAGVTDSIRQHLLIRKSSCEVGSSYVAIMSMIISEIMARANCVPLDISNGAHGLTQSETSQEVH